MTSIYSEINVDSKVKAKLPKCSSEDKAAQIEEISLTAKNIWKKIIEYYLKNKTNEGQIELLSQLQNEYKEFFLSFPLVLRWMVEMKQFKINVFKEYLDKFISTEIGSKTEFLKLQGYYLVMLFKEFNKSASKEDIENYEREINDYLMIEDESFKEMEEEAKEEIKAEAKKMSREKKEILYNTILRKKALNSSL